MPSGVSAELFLVNIKMALYPLPPFFGFEVKAATSGGWLLDGINTRQQIPDLT
jgi:hypothetical protein